MKSTKELYEKRKRVYDSLHQKQRTASDRLSNLRLLVILAGIAISVFLYLTHNFILLTCAVIITLVLFTYLVIKHEKLNENEVYSAALSGINESSVKRCIGEWTEFKDDGREFIDESHNFSYDLDIFGANSLFQFINTARTYFGRNKLYELLTDHPSDVSDILMRQKAIEELAIKYRWRQRFQAEGLIAQNRMNNPEDMISWVNESNSFFRKPWVSILVKILPAVTILLLLLAWTTEIIPKYIPVLALIFQYILLSVNRKERERSFRLAKKYREDIVVYYHMIKSFEKQKFSSDYLKNLQNNMRNSANQTAYLQTDKLSKIIGSLNNRGNAFYIVFNILTLWDYQNLIALEKWKGKSGAHLKTWLLAIGNVEALSSLSLLRFDNQDWVVPEFETSKGCIFEAKGMGHPLLTGKRETNDLGILPPIKSILITGSNMSGKSTLLRAAGINLVLAYTGAPVCAEFFRVSLMELHTCMRVSDNLGKSISSFYAELLRIKTVVSEATEGKSVFYLLDEIFKGTNSRDRHSGAKVLVKKLCTTNSVGMVSTHDLELCELEQENKAVRNYHFEEYYKDNRIYFDYKLRPGASKTRNAIFLMKMAGIEVEDINI